MRRSLSVVPASPLSRSIAFASGRAAAVCACVLLLAGCRRAESPRVVAPQAPQISGAVTLAGLHGPVTVVRDTWGVPHISAATSDDLFFAQGYIQAQDRLFQMDLWKRAAQGRLAEVLGANFIQRDSMTRRIQFRGSYEREWASYGPDARQIAVAFTNGINAWVAQARHTVPEEFAVAGWLPEPWKPEDLLNRTDAFMASGNAMDDLFRARMVAALGAATVDQLLPLPQGQRTVSDLGVDLSAVTFVVSDALRRLGTPPFFTTLTNPVSEAPRPSLTTGGADVPLTSGETSTLPRPRARELRLQPGRIGPGAGWVLGPSRTTTNAPLLAFAEFNRLETPAHRYLVHLTAPGIDVIGATSPWLPGVAIGHNARVAWSFTPSDDDTQDIFVERVNPENAHQVARDGRWVDMAVDTERVWVLGRDKPVEYERLYTPNGVVIAQDRERHLVYALRWAGTELGGAGELAALALLKVSSWPEFKAALTHWKAPAAEFLYADVEGRIARQRAGLVPIRADGRGALPSAAWLSPKTWQGLRDLSLSPADDASSSGVLLGSAVATPQAGVISQKLTASERHAPADLATMQTDLQSPHAEKLLEALAKVGTVPEKVATARGQLLAWDRRFKGDAAETVLYTAWEGAVRQRLAARMVKPELVEELAARLDPVVALEGPLSRGAGGYTGPWRGILLADALSDAVSQIATDEGLEGSLANARAQATLAHPLGVFAIGQRRFNVGPYALNGHTDTVFTTDGRRGPVLRMILNPADWNSSQAVSAPGQAGSPSSPNYDDQAGRWAAGSLIDLVFDQAGQPPQPARTLTLKPR